MTDQTRVPAGVPTGGQFAASAHAESGVSLAEQTSPAADLAAQGALQIRTQAAEMLLEYPDGVTVHTLAWPEEPNEDGTFDVALTDVHGLEGGEIENLGDLGDLPAGWLTGDERGPYRTAYDVWRTDSTDPDSPIEVTKIRAWSSALGARLNETPEQARDRNLRERRANAVSTRFDDLRPGDRFVVDRHTAPVEVEVTGPPVDAKDMFGRPMKNLPCKRLDTGEEGPYMYGPDGHAWKVAPGAADTTDPVERASEIAAVPDSLYTGSGWGEHRPTRALLGVEEVAVGDVIAEHNANFGARNLFVVTGVIRRGDAKVVYGIFGDPTDPTRRRMDDDGVIARWDYEFADGTRFATGTRVDTPPEPPSSRNA